MVRLRPNFPLSLTLLLVGAALFSACGTDEPAAPGGASIRLFEVAPDHLEEPGEVTVRWVTSGAASLELLRGEEEVSLVDRRDAGDSIALFLTETTTFTLTASGSAGDSVSATHTVTVEPRALAPSIAGLTAPEAVQADEDGEAVATIAWAGVERATELVLLAEGRAPIELNPEASEGSVDVTISEETVLELVARNEAGEASLSATVRVVQLPTIEVFDADRLRVGFGEATTVRWAAIGAAYVELWQDEVRVADQAQPEGSQALEFTSSSNLELRAFNELDGSTAATLEIAVGAPLILEFQSSSNSIWLGEAPTLSWLSLGGSQLTVIHDGSGETICETSKFEEIETSSCTWSPEDEGTQFLTLSVSNPSGVDTSTLELFAAPGPLITHFDASPKILSVGDDFTIGWSVLGDPAGNEPTLLLTDDRGNTYEALEAEGSLSVAALEPGAYELQLLATTDHPGSSPGRATVNLLVHPIPSMEFTASPEHFDDSVVSEVTFSWNTRDAEAVTLYRLVDGAPELLLEIAGDQRETGSFNLAPREGGSYRLVASNAIGASVARDLTITVAPLEVLVLDAAPQTFIQGQKIRLHWVSRMADEVQIDIGTKGYLLEETAAPYLDLPSMGGTQTPLTDACGTLANLGCAEILFPAGFEFPFGGVQHARAWVYTTGYLGFTTGSRPDSLPVNQAFPTEAQHAGISLAPFWDQLRWDLERYPAGNIFTALLEEDGEEIFVIQWRDIGQNLSDWRGASFNFEVVLRRGGSFDFRYGPQLAKGTNIPSTVLAGESATIGWQLPDQSDFGLLGHNGTLPMNGPPAHRTFSYSPLAALPLSGELVFAPFGPQRSFPVTITATRGGASHSKTVTLEVQQKPIVELTSETIPPAAMGEDFLLGWRSSHATALVVLDEEGATRCTASTPEMLTDGFCLLSEEEPGRYTYTVRATGANGVVAERSISVHVFGAFGVASFSADADSIEKGGDLLLSWEAFGGVSVLLFANGTEIFSGPGGNGPGDFLVTGVQVETEFRLVVENDVGAKDEATLSVTLWDVMIGLQASTTSVRPNDPITITVDAKTLAGGAPVKVYGLLPMAEVPGPDDRYADISSHAQAVNHNINQSQSAAVVPIQFPEGFTFPFMGVEMTQLTAFADGYVSFTPGATTISSNQLLPPPPGAFGAIVHLAPFWDDLHPRGVGRLHSARTSDDTFVIQWSQMNTTGGTTNANPQDLNFQIVFHRSGTFEYRYGTMAPHPTYRPTSGCIPNDCTNEVNGSSATIGYQSSDGTAGHTYHFGGQGTHVDNRPVPGGLSGRTLRYQTIDGSGSFTFFPQKSETFSFCAVTAGGPICKDLRVEADFGLRSATLSKEHLGFGEPVTLSWESVGGKILNVHDGDTVVHTTTNLAEIDQGSLVLHPTKDTVYVLELIAGSRRVTTQRVVEIDRFGLTATATSSSAPGAPVTLGWNLHRADPAASLQVIAPMEEIPNTDWSTYDISNDPSAQIIGANVDNQNVTLTFSDFTFPYFGTEHASIRVATDGYLHWETSGTSTPGNQPIPNTTGSNHAKAIAPFWDDLHTRQNGRVFAKKIDADRYVIQWNRMSLRWGSETINEGNLNFLVVLHRDGGFEFRYHFMDPPPSPATSTSHCNPLSCERESNGSSATIGYQIPGGRAGHQIHFGGTNRGLAQPTVPGGLAHRAWKFTSRTGAGAGSVQVNPADSTLYKICALDEATSDLVCAPAVSVDVPWGVDLFQVNPGAPMAGQPVTVSWSVRGVEWIQIVADGTVLETHQGTTLPLIGSLTHTPTGTTSYAIEARSMGRTVVETRVVALRAFDLKVTGPTGTFLPGDEVEVRWQLNQHLPGSISMLTPMSEIQIGQGQEGGFLDVSGLAGATQLTLSGASGSVAVPLAFPFPYLGTQQNGLRVFADGYLSFTATGGNGVAENLPLPTSVYTTSEVHLAPFWDDLILRTGDSVWSYAPDASTLIIQWKQLSIAPLSSASDRFDLNFQVVLRADGSFEYRYGRMAPPPGPSSHPECKPTSCADEANGSGATIGYQSVDARHGSNLHLGSLEHPHEFIDWGDPDTIRPESFFPFSGGLSHRSFRYTPATSGSARIVVGRTSEQEVCGILGDFIECGSVRIDVVEPGDVMITEAMIDPAGGAPSQWVEIRNLSARTIDLQGFELRSSQGSHRIASALPLPPKAFATLASSTQVGFTPDYVYGGEVPLTRLADTLELRAGVGVISSVTWGTDWDVPRNQTLSLDPAFHLTGVQSNSKRAQWCVLGGGGSPGTLGDGCVNPWYQSDPLSDRPFIDIAPTGTRFHDIEGFGLLARLPSTGFKVKLFGREHSRIWVTTNGVISLIDTAPLANLGVIESPSRLPLTTSLNLGPHIAAFWTILDCNAACRFYYERRQVDGADVLILQWDRFRVAPRAHPPTSLAEQQAYITFQLQLWENGEIVVAFDEINHPFRIGTPVWASYLGRDAWVGFESATKTDFVSGHYRQLMSLEGRSFLFQPR